MTERPGADGRQPIVLTAGSIAGVAGGTLLAGDAARVVDAVSIDTRTLAPGALFFAIRGPRFDGHAFVGAAIEAGASGVVVSGPIEMPRAPAGPEPVVIRVGDTVAALQAVGSSVRRLSGARVVAVSGSAGKTTTKEATAEFLAARYEVFRSQGNLNNHLGVPLSLVELRRRPEVAVVELGMNHAGELSGLVAIADPDVRVWTNVAEVHSEFFPSIDAIADAKAEILEGARDDTVLVANADDPLVMARATRFRGKTVTFGIDSAADVRAAQVRDEGLDGVSAAVQTPAGRTLLRTPLLGRGNLANVLAATTVAIHLGVPLDVIAQRAARLRPAANRGEVLRLAGGITLVDDSYNSNPRALERVLEVVEHEARSARRVAVLGEMLELGERSAELHEASGRAAARAGLQFLITIGGSPAAALARAAVEAGMPASSVRHVAASADAVPLALELVRPGDLVLVKGSHGVRMDLVVERLKAEFA
jgi:UDP-N-acetylmuramoyl-tripeptide--D-alanyl-D-alanine ligase